MNSIFVRLFCYRFETNMSLYVSFHRSAVVTGVRSANMNVRVLVTWSAILTAQYTGNLWPSSTGQSLS